MSSPKPRTPSTPGPKPKDGRNKLNYCTRLSVDVIEFLRTHHAGDAATWIEKMIRKAMRKEAKP